MNAPDILYYGNTKIHEYIDELSEAECEAAGVCGWWSVKEIMAPDLCRLPGTLPWYGNRYSLDDFIVYTFYGHKREHGAQIGVYRDKIGR